MESWEQAESSSAPAPAPVSCRSPTCPPWLQAAIADIEQRVRALAVDEAPPPEHSFAERAENYYHKRPQLLSLLTDLHRRYLSLADRYSQSLSTLHHHKQHASSSLPARGKRKGKGKGSGGGGWWARVRMAAEWTPCAPAAATVAVRKVGEQVVKGKEDDGKYYYGGGCFCV